MECQATQAPQPLWMISEGMRSKVLVVGLFGLFVVNPNFLYSGCLTNSLSYPFSSRFAFEDFMLLKRRSWLLLPPLVVPKRQILMRGCPRRVPESQRPAFV